MIFNNTALTKYEECPRLFYLEEVLRLQRRPHEDSRNIDREQGVLWHEMMDLWRRVDKQEAEELEFQPCIRRVGRIQQVQDHVKSYYNARIAVAQFEEEKLFEIECERYMLALFDAYIERYPTDSFEVVDTERDFITCLGDECPSCGEPYHEDLRRGMTVQQRCDALLSRDAYGDNGFEDLRCEAEIDYLVGRADLIVSENGLVKLWDYKTKKATAGVSVNTLSGYGTSSQFTQYMYGIGRVLNRVVANGVVDVVVKLKEIAKKGNPFRRNEEIVKGPLDYAAFVADRRALLVQIRADLAQLQPDGTPKASAYPFRRNPNHCYKYGPCPMLDICHPARHTWWAPPEAVAHEYTTRPTNYVDNYRALIEEEIE